jgi:2-C-methyl-D-erythritol 4-phosphate cytidylyltransferase
MNMAVILPAAGASSRFAGTTKKPLMLLRELPIWVRTVQLFSFRSDVINIVVVVNEADHASFLHQKVTYCPNEQVVITTGGKERYDSVRNGLNCLSNEVDLIAIHDAVRPLCSAEDIDRVISKAKDTGAAILATPVVDTIKRCQSTNTPIEATVSRVGLWRALTPQVFEVGILRDAYSKLHAKSLMSMTDDAQLVEACGYHVHLVEGSSENIKITVQADLIFAEAILALRESKL